MEDQKMEKEKKVQLSVTIAESAKRALVDMAPGRHAIGYTLSEIINRAYQTYKKEGK
jgi:hypothetical protein